MDFKLIVTFGPAIRDRDRLREIDGLGKCIYRLNGAHVPPKQVAAEAAFIRGVLPGAEIMLDLPGNKVRIKHLSEPLPLTRGQTFSIRSEQFNYPDFYEHVKPGDIALTHDSEYAMEVKAIEGQTIVFESRFDGILLPNKGVHVQGANRSLPFLFPLDHELISAGVEASVELLSLSFVRTADDIREVKSLLADHGGSPNLVSKIETAQALENLGDIFFEVDTVNVDRGDLSADVGILRLPMIQERVVDAAKRAEKKVFLATQFLKNMEERPVPLIAEVVDLYKTIKTGVDGIQLSEETSVGKYPVECVQLVFQMFRESFSSA